MKRNLIPILILSIVLAACERDEPQSPPPSLLDAAEQGDLQTIDNFLKGRQLVNMRNACLWTPLMKAALNGHYDAAVKLLDKGAEVDLVDKGGYSAMMLAASNNFAEVVELLLQRGASIDLVEHTHGWTALIWAAKRGHTETVRVLLRHSADRTVVDDQGMSALDHARQKGFAAIVELLSAPIAPASASVKSRD